MDTNEQFGCSGDRVRRLRMFYDPDQGYSSFKPYSEAPRKPETDAADVHDASEAGDDNESRSDDPGDTDENNSDNLMIDETILRVTAYIGSNRRWRITEETDEDGSNLLFENRNNIEDSASTAEFSEEKLVTRNTARRGRRRPSTCPSRRPKVCTRITTRGQSSSPPATTRRSRPYEREPPRAWRGPRTPSSSPPPEDRDPPSADLLPYIWFDKLVREPPRVWRDPRTPSGLPPPESSGPPPAYLLPYICFDRLVCLSPFTRQAE